MKSHRPPKIRSGRTNPWIIAGIVVFVVFDLLLVWWAFTSTRGAQGAAGDVDGLGEVPTVTWPTESSSPVPTPLTDFEVAAPTAVLAAVSESVAFRAPAGSCPAVPASLEVTTDGGATWSPAVVPGASAIQSVESDDGELVTVVARRADSCAPLVYRCFVQGVAWQETGELPSFWYLDGGSVVAPGGGTSAPCEAPVQLAARSDAQTAVLCADAVVYATGDAGATWAGSSPIDGVAAIAATGSAYLVALEGHDGCAGVQVAALGDDLAPGAAGGCLESDAPEGATVLAASADGASTWVWSGEVVARSADGGATW
ncbi:hypothetical protein ET445_16625 [Agromyces protaetiae]|uniref:Exo-alpha-sialidase n=1 Tax=Agromyces protaetiae TaxID=2509455 RepID=A0A4P6FJD9_9MICO|nr:hypothetical protein [Agromyces protaetiae]QAY74719.1 hypothetical protein ET445_16625 [Agromyces protaetiae]